MIIGKIATGIRIPIGGYDYNNAVIGYNTPPQRRLSFNLTAERGTFWFADGFDRDITRVTIGCSKR